MRRFRRKKPEGAMSCAHYALGGKGAGGQACGLTPCGEVLLGGAATEELHGVSAAATEVTVKADACAPCDLIRQEERLV